MLVHGECVCVCLLGLVLSVVLVGFIDMLGGEACEAGGVGRHSGGRSCSRIFESSVSRREPSRRRPEHRRGSRRWHQAPHRRPLR